MKKSRIFIFSILIIILSFGTQAFATENDSLTNTIEINNLQKFEESSSENLKIPDSMEILPDLVLETNQVEIPIYVEDRLDSENAIELDILQEFLVQAAKNQPMDTKKQSLNFDAVAEAYEFVSVEENVTYAFYNNPEGEIMIIVTPTEKSLADFNLSQSEAQELIPQPKGEVDMKGGNGTRARTSSSSASYITATLKSGAPNYNGSEPDEGSGGKVINFYNYMGFSVNGLETDLGLKWSKKKQGWNVFGNVADGSTFYGHLDATATLTNYDFIYKATTSYPATLKVEKYYNYNGSNRVRLTVNGTLTNLSSGTSILIMPRGTTSNVNYKILTTIAAKDEAYIMKGASISTNYSNICLNTTKVPSFASLETDNATLSYSNYILNSVVKKR